MEINAICTQKVFVCCLEEFTIKSNKLVICKVYRSRKIEYIEVFLEKLNQLISILLKINSDIVITGDLNDNVLSNEISTKYFTNLLTCYGFKPLINVQLELPDSNEIDENNFTLMIENNIIEK